MPTLTVHVHKTDTSFTDPYAFEAGTSGPSMEDFLSQLQQHDQRYRCLDEGADVFLASPVINRDTPSSATRLDIAVEVLTTNAIPNNLDRGHFFIDERCEYIRWRPQDPLFRPLIAFDKGISLNCFIFPKRFTNKADNPSPSKKAKVDVEVDANNEEGGVPMEASNSGDSVAATVEERTSVMKKINDLVKKIREIQPEPLTDPKSLTTFIYPALAPFSIRNKDLRVIGNHYGINFRGRSTLTTLLDSIKSRYNSGANTPTLRLFGTFGAGVRQLAIAASVTLMAQGFPVVLIQLSASTRDVTVRDALLMALSTTPEGRKQISRLFNACDGKDNLRNMRKFCNHIRPKIKLLFIFLHGGLEVDDKYLSLAETHVLCYTANPNSNHFRRPCRYGIEEMIFIKGGLPEGDFNDWYRQYQGSTKHLTNDMKDVIKEATGGVPRILEGIVQKVVDAKKFSEEFLEQQEAAHEFENYMEETLIKEPETTRRSQEIIAAAITNGPGPSHAELRQSPDRRFIYPENWRWTCPGLIIRKMLKAYAVTQEDLMRYLELKEWLDMFRRVKNNPCQVGFAVEGSLLSEISSTGLSITAGTESLKFDARLAIRRFDDILEMKDDISTLFVPKAYNYRYIDAVIVYYNKTDKKVIVCPIQCSMVRTRGDHKDSCRQFFEPEGDWERWRQSAIIPQSWELHWVFLWTLRTVAKQPKTRIIDPKPNKPPQIPNYVEWVTDFRLVSRRTAKALKDIGYQ